MGLCTLELLGLPWTLQVHFNKDTKVIFRFVKGAPKLLKGVWMPGVL